MDTSPTPESPGTPELSISDRLKYSANIAIINGYGPSDLPQLKDHFIKLSEAHLELAQQYETVRQFGIRCHNALSEAQLLAENIQSHNEELSAVLNQCAAELDAKDAKIEALARTVATLIQANLKQTATLNQIRAKAAEARQNLQNAGY